MNELYTACSASVRSNSRFLTSWLKILSTLINSCDEWNNLTVYVNRHRLRKHQTHMIFHEMTHEDRELLYSIYQVPKLVGTLELSEMGHILYESLTTAWQVVTIASPPTLHYFFCTDFGFWISDFFVRSLPALKRGYEQHLQSWIVLLSNTARNVMTISSVLEPLTC